MNRAQLPQATEPTGCGIRWCVAEILRPRQFEPIVMQPEIPEEPALRSPTSIALWNVICALTEPIEKAAWIDKARIFGRVMRSRASSSIVNLRDQGWVTEDIDGFFKKAHRE